MSETPILKTAQDKLRPFEHRLLDTFAKVFQRKRPPTSLRALQPLAMVFLLEAFGLAFLLDRETVRLAVLAARGPGKGDDDDLLDDSDEMSALRWAAERQQQLDRAFRSFARDLYNDSSLQSRYTFGEWMKAGKGPDRVEFERVWGTRSPIDPATAPRCFDPRAQLSILDAVSTERDGYLGAFLSDMSLRSGAPPVVEYMGQTIDFVDCQTLDTAAWRAVSKGWIVFLDHRGSVMGLRLIPRTDGIQTRLRAPLVNIVSMYADDPRDTKIALLENEKQNLVSIIETFNNCALVDKERDRQWQDATGASDPEMARELTAQRVEQIKSLTAERDAVIGSAKCRVDDERTTEVAECAANQIADTINDPNLLDKVGGIGRMIWPDPDNAPTPLACANAIVAHRRGEFVELEFPVTPKIFENIRAWLMFHSFGLRAPTPDATGYCTCAIGPGGEIPPAWNTMKQGKRDSYPGFALFGPHNTGKVVFCAKEPSIKKATKRSAKKAAL